MSRTFRFLLVTLSIIVASAFTFSTSTIQTRRTNNRLLSSSALFSSSSDDDVSSSSSSSAQNQHQIVVAMTREDGKNGKLRKALLSHPRLTESNICVEELPCIAHADGPDSNQLAVALKEKSWDYVAVTSPEAAKVLAGSWNFNAESSSSSSSSSESSSELLLPQVAAVGKATQKALEDLGISVSFCPSKATAQTLVEELPAVNHEDGQPTTLLYPASAKAKPTLQKGLEARGFHVTRLDTYDTVTAKWTPEQQEMAGRVQVLCVGSPSALNGWLQNNANQKDVLAACIGETSFKACMENKWNESCIFYPEKPGVPGWADSVADAVESIVLAHA